MITLTASDGTELERLRRAFYRARCMFTISTGRTATETMARLANLSPEVRAYHEPEPKLRNQFQEAYRHVRTSPESFTRLLDYARCEIVGKAALEDKVYVEGPALASFAPAIAQMLPGSKFLLMHRHPAGVVRSCMRRGHYSGHSWDRYKQVPLPEDPASETWATWDAFSKNCWRWNAINSFLLEFVDSISPDRVLWMPFREFVDDESGRWRKLFSFLDVEPPLPDRVREVLQVRHNKQGEGQFPRFEEWSDFQKNTMYELCGHTMQRLGYV